MRNRNINQILCTVSAGALIGVGGPAWAQAVAPAGAAPTATAQAGATTGSAPPNALQEVVVTAQKRRQSLQDVPISVTVESKQTLDRADIQTTRNLSELAPALTFTSGFTPQTTTFNIRGVGSYVYRIGIQPAVSTVLDGIALARPGDFVADLGDVDRVEILSGPQGTLFGRNSTGGVINIARTNPGPTFGGYVDGQYARGRLGENEYELKTAINLPINDMIKTRASYYNRQNGAYVKNLAPNASDAGAERAQGGTLKVDFAPTDRFDALFTADAATDFNQTGDPNILVPLQSYQQPNIPNITGKQLALNQAIGQRFEVDDSASWFYHQNLWDTTLDVTYKFTPELRLRSLTSFRANIIDTNAAFYPGPSTPSNTLGFDLVSASPDAIDPHKTTRMTDWSYWTEEDRLEYSIKRLSLTGGIYYTQLLEREDSELPNYKSATALGSVAAAVGAVGTASGPSAAFPYYFSDTLTEASDRNEVLAGFFDGTVHLTDSISIYGGYRLSHEKLDYAYSRFSWSNVPVQYGVNFNQATGTPLAPPSRVSFAGSHAETDYAARAGASWDVTPRQHFYATWSRGYVGSAVDLSNGSAGTPANPGAALLRPSTSVSYEIGYKSELFDRRVRFNMAVFDQQTKDIQVSALIPGTNVNVVQNAGNISAYGGEFNLEMQPTARLNVVAGLALTHAVFENLTQTCYPGQSFAQGCNYPVNGRFVQNVAGKPALNTPTVKFNIAPTYNIPLDQTFFDMYVRAQYQWQNKVYYQLDHDPLASQDAYGILNLSVGFVTHDGRYELRLFADNVTNQYYCPNEVNGPAARQSCQSSPLDAQVRGGFNLRAAF